VKWTGLNDEPGKAATDTFPLTEEKSVWWWSRGGDVRMPEHAVDFN
jgi:hypothetical protein